MAEDIANIIVKKLEEANRNVLPTAKEAQRLSMVKIKQEAEQKVLDAIKKGGIFRTIVYQSGYNYVNDILYDTLEETFESKGYICERVGGKVTVYWTK